MASSIHCEVIQALEAAGTVNVFVICLDKHVSVHNTIDREFGLELARAVCLARKKAVQGEIDVVVVCSAKEKSFLAGANILYELKMVGVEGSQRAFVESRLFQNILCSLEALSVPTVAILNGVTVGGGLEVALACDYRIADSKHCKQIGLPEVKLGVLPGVGGCCRLPRLIGFKSSLTLLLTGQAITAQKALKLGIIDHTMDSTETVVHEDSLGQKSYRYEWLSSVLACVEKKRIGKRSFEVSVRTELSAVDSCHREEESSLSEDKLMRELSESWEECEKKATWKYPRIAGRWNLFWSFVKNLLFYIMAVFQLWRTVGLRMPAPYTCLQTTFRCLYTNSWLEAMSRNSLGFTTLIMTAESKSLMNLFLMTRKLKKFALTFGLGSSEKSPENLDKENTAVFVLISKTGLRFSSAFIQGLLYAEWEVCVYEVNQGIRKDLQRLVRKHFNYALKRGYLKMEEVEERMEKLQFISAAERNDGKQTCLVVNAAFSEDTNEAMSTLLSQFPKCIQVDLTPFSGSPRRDGTLLVNMGDPLRKNTLCVEISPSSSKVLSEDVRTTAAFISSLGKIPVVTPVTPSIPMSHSITLRHWVLAAKMLACSGMSAKQVDSCLVSAGFTKGPFATMKELDRAYVSQMVEIGTKSGVDCATLTSYLSNKLTVKYKRGKTPPTSKIADLFLYNAASSSLLVKKLCPEVPEGAIDALCVSGLLHFPPTEGGPLNYLARVGYNPLEDLAAACESTALQEEADLLLRSIQSSDGARKLFLESEDKDEEGVSEFRKRRSEFTVLSAADLRLVGATRGVQDMEVFLYPVVFGVIVMVFLFFFVVILGYKMFAYPLVMLSAYIVHCVYDALFM